MTTVRYLRRFVARQTNAAGKMLLATAALLLLCLPAQAQQTPPRHWLHAGVMPPGAIGSQRLLRSGPLSGYNQPVKIYGAKTLQIAALSNGGYTEARQEELLVSLYAAHVYRFRVTGVKNYPEAEIYPTVEVIGRLFPPCGKELHFPIPVELTTDELQQAAEGAFITRVIYVEDPLTALPVAQKEGELWQEARPDQDPLIVADTMGRPVAILRIGARRPADASLQTSPYIQIHEPPVELTETETSDQSSEDITPASYGQACPSGDCNGGTCGLNGCNTGSGCTVCRQGGKMDEYLCDGGDCGPGVAVRKDWVIEGLDQEDTVVHYDTLDGCVIVQPSNRVCIYAPRFGVVRRLVNVMASQQRQFINVFEDDMLLAEAERKDLVTTTLQQLPPVTRIGERPPSLLLNRQQAGEFEARVVVRELLGMIKPYCNLQVIKLGIHDNAEKPWLAKATVAALTWTGDQAAQVTIGQQAASVLIGSVSPGVVYAGPKGKPCLRLIKLASTDMAKPGDEIEFTLRFDNVGTEKVGNVTIVDNLSTRLALVKDSAESSVGADFSTSQNSAGSLILRWEIKEPVEPGKGGILQFKVKVL